MLMRNSPSDTPLSINSYYHPAARLALIVAGTICACFFLRLASLTLPLGDDLCRAVAVPVNELPSEDLPVGLVPSVGWTYNHWSGRWAGVGLETILLPKVPERYPWLLVFLALAQAGLLYAAHRLLGVQRAVALFYTSLFALVLWSGLPDIREGVFWATGIIENQFPLPLALLSLALLLSADTQISKARITRAVLAIVLAFLIPAFHELVGGVFVLVLFGATVVVIHRRSTRRGTWIAACVVAAISFLIVFLAPGNALRASTLHYHAQAWRALNLSLGTVRLYLIPWCLDLKLWALVVIICLDPMIGSIRKQFPSISHRGLAVISVALLALVVAAMVTALWILGHTLQGRTLDLLYGVFLAGWVAIAFLLSPSLSLNLADRRVLSSAALVLLAVAAVVSNNNVGVASDLVSGRASEWHEQVRQRFQLFRSSDRASDVQLPPLTVSSPNLRSGNITSDPTNWSNRCMSAYFGVHSVRTVTRTDDSQIGEGAEKQQ